MPVVTGGGNPPDIEESPIRLEDTRTARIAPRRRVTEIPRETEQWFRDHGPDAAGQARELARAELTAGRDDHVFRWVHPWTCQLLEPDAKERLIATAHDVMLDGTPGTGALQNKVCVRRAGACDVV